jgi:hypothetical protein
LARANHHFGLNLAQAALGSQTLFAVIMQRIGIRSGLYGELYGNLEFIPGKRREIPPGQLLA